MQIQPPRSGPLILIVERDQKVRELQRHFLEEAGFTVAFAEEGESALARARLDMPAAIVTEILVPKLDGLALCRRLRDEPRTRDIPVLVFSILAAEGRAGEAGASAFLRKPLVASVFVASVRGLVAAHHFDAMEQQ